MCERRMVEQEPEAVVLRCRSCDAEVERRRDVFLDALALGWPTCCGETMLYLRLPAAQVRPANCVDE